MERVALRLEQSLPQLELLAQHNVFTRDELRALTTQRSTHEAHLARREVAWSDYEAYVQFEDRAEQLRQLRCRQPEVAEAMSPHDDRKLKSAYIARVITVFERALRRLKADLRVWLSYADWARRHNMNIVLGRVLGRAIVLHPKQPSLWILAARQELALDPWAKGARTLFLRALRVNQPTPTTSSQSATPPPRKRSKQPNGSSLSRDPPPSQDGLLYISHAHVRDYVHLALEYLRMELTVIERTRRRFTKLGIDLAQPRADLAPPAAGEERQPDQAAAQDDDTAEKEAVQMTRMPTAESKNEEKPPQQQDQPPAKEGPSDQRLAAVLHHAVQKLVLPLLPSPASEFAFLLAVYRMVLGFPFVDAVNAAGSGAEFRNDLLDFLAARMSELDTSTSAEVVLVARCATTPIVKPTPLWSLDSVKAQHQQEEEMDSFNRLKAAGDLRLLLPDTELGDVLAPEPSANATLVRLSAVLAAAVRVRRAFDDTSLPTSLVTYNASISSTLLHYVNEESRVDQAARVAQAHVLFLQAIRQGDEPPELARLLGALLSQAYQSAKRGKYLSPPLVLAYFTSQPTPSDEQEARMRADAIRKSLRSSSSNLSLSEQEAWEPVWALFLDAVVASLGGEVSIQSSKGQEAVDTLEAMFAEHLNAVQACPVQASLWMRAVNLVRGGFAVRDKKVDKWALGAFSQLVHLSRRAVTQNHDSSLSEGLQLAHDRLLAAVAATPAQLTKSRSAKSASKARTAVRALIRSDPIASPAFWLAHARTEANLFRTLSDADEQEELQAVRTYLSQLWSRLRQSTASDPTLLVPARLLWLRHLLRDTHDGSSALAALDVSRRDAAALDPRLVPLLESGWQRLSDGRPYEEEEDEEDDDEEEESEEDEE